MRIKRNSWQYLFLVLLFFLFYTFSQRGGGGYVVAEVIDGDTIKLTTGEKVRYIGIDTPELRSSREKAEYYAEEAYRVNKKLVAGKRVTLEFDVQKRDRYGRILAYVYVDGLMVNEWLVANGYARVATFPPNVKYAERFRALEREARRQKLGLWGGINLSFRSFLQEERLIFTHRGQLFEILELDHGVLPTFPPVPVSV